MRLYTLNLAIFEAKRFLLAAQAVEIETVVPDHGKPWDKVKEYTKESAACKRASLDLTRALAELRKP